jgi:hypothetical protein
VEFIRVDINCPEMGLYKIQFESGAEAVINCSQFASHLAKDNSLPGKSNRQQIFAEDPDLIQERRTIEIKERLKEIEQKEKAK